MSAIMLLRNFSKVNSCRPFVMTSCRQDTQLAKAHESKTSPLRQEVIQLYKNLIYLSREWPTDLRPQIKRAFLKNRHVTDGDEIRKLIDKGEYICREITATYYLRKYRAMKRRYYSEHENKHLQELFKSFSS